MSNCGRRSERSNTNIPIIRSNKLGLIKLYSLNYCQVQSIKPPLAHKGVNYAMIILSPPALISVYGESAVRGVLQAYMYKELVPIYDYSGGGGGLNICFCYALYVCNCAFHHAFLRPV